MTYHSSSITLPIILMALLFSASEHSHAATINLDDKNNITQHHIIHSSPTRPSTTPNRAMRYEEEISVHISSRKFLPSTIKEKLRTKNITNDLTVSHFVIIDTDGTIQQVVTTEKSGYDFVDNFAKNIIYDASPFPPVPKEVPTSETELYQFHTTLKFTKESWQPRAK